MNDPGEGDESPMELKQASNPTSHSERHGLPSKVRDRGQVRTSEQTR